MPFNLNQEAAKIAAELGKVVFVGALAVNHYSGYRMTHDIDLATISPLDEEKLTELGYRKYEESRGTSWFTPRGIKVDFYTRDVGRIPVTWILEKAVAVQVGRKSIKMICLEGIILAKHRASRAADVADLRQLLTRCGSKIRWDIMEEVANPVELAELRQVSKALSA